MPVHDRDWYREIHRRDYNLRGDAIRRPGQRSSGAGRKLCWTVFIFILAASILGAAFFSPLGENIDNETFQEFRGKAKEFLMNVIERMESQPEASETGPAGTSRSAPNEPTESNLTPKSNCRTEKATIGSDGEYSSSNLNVIEVTIETSTESLTGIRGEVIDRCQEAWAWASDPGAFGTFTIYCYPDQACFEGLRCPPEDSIGSVLPRSNWILESGDVITSTYALSEDVFIIEFRRKPS